jgi:hypothetical protein
MPTPRVRRLDSQNDATFGKGSANYAEETESTEQRLLCYLRGILGEYFLDTDRFIPWIQPEDSDVKPIMGANGPRDLGYGEALVKAGILGIDGIASIKSFTLSFDPNVRHLSIDAVVLDDDGNPIVLQQFNPLGGA